MDPDVSRGRFALALALVALVGLPLSYSWVLSPGEDPVWLRPVIAVAEWGGLAAALAALWLASRTRARAGVRAKRVALGALAIYAGTFIVLAAVYRS
jgi:hypothetical protein